MARKAPGGFAVGVGLGLLEENAGLLLGFRARRHNSCEDERQEQQQCPIG
jgi:hypothetical protein